jgi:trehalose-6-phosphate synthase
LAPLSKGLPVAEVPAILDRDLLHAMLGQDDKTMTERQFEIWTNEIGRPHAEHIARQAPPEAIIAVQDYGNIPALSVLRKSRPDVKIVYSHHVPFAENFTNHPRALPILQALMSADAVNFLTVRDAEAFTSALNDHSKSLGSPWVFPHLGHANVEIGGYVLHSGLNDKHLTRIGVVPLGIDIDEEPRVNDALETQQEMRRLRGLANGRTIVAVAGRVETTKGQHLVAEAYLDLLDRGAIDPSRVLLYIRGDAVSEGNSPVRHEGARRLEVAVQRMNNIAPGAVIYERTRFNAFEGCAIAQVADVRAEVPVRDGFGLALAQQAFHGDAWLVMSKEAGASTVFGEYADVVDPANRREVKDALFAGIHADVEGSNLAALRGRRVAALQNVVRAHTAGDWMEQTLLTGNDAKCSLQGLRSPHWSTAQTFSASQSFEIGA